MTDTTINKSMNKLEQAKYNQDKPYRLFISLELDREKREPLRLNIDQALLLGEGIWGIFGQSGTGKSTLLKALAGLYKNAEYGFSIQDDSAAAESRVSTYNNLAASDNPCVYLGAESILFEHLNVKDNLRLVQKQGGFSEFAKLSYQQIVDLCGIQNLLTQNASALSSGEAQRVKFARALQSGKPCILLDEAFSALDWPTRRYFSSVIVNLHKEHGLAFVVVSHSLRELALSCSYISEFCEGKLIKSDHAAKMLEHLQFASSKASSVGFSSNTQGEDYSGDVFSLLRVKVLINDEHAKLAECALLDDDTANVVWVRANTPLIPGQNYKLTLDADKVSLSTSNVSNTSMLNSLCGKVVAIQHYKSVVLISMLVASQKLHAAISIRSFEHLDIKLDDEVFALFKAL